MSWCPLFLNGRKRSRKKEKLRVAQDVTAHRVEAPFKPRVPHSLGEVPKTLPSYLVEARSVRQTPISQDRHALLGPWVLRNICGPIDLGRKQGAAAQGTGFYEYDFLSSKPNKAPRLEDLNSEEVSRLVHSGFIFWGPEEVSLPHADENSAAQADDDNLELPGSEVTLDVGPLWGGSEKGDRITPGEEEEVVELMLGEFRDALDQPSYP